VTTRAFRAATRLAGALLLAVAILGGCSRQEPLGDNYFVGKWHSSKAKTAIRMDERGEWELLASDGSVAEYGVWQYFDNKVMWSVMTDGNMHHDINAVMSAGPKEFTLRERDGSVTTFARLD
jgi:hypothetical protein